MVVDELMLGCNHSFLFSSDGILRRFYVTKPITDAHKGVEGGKMWKIVAQKCNKTRKRGPLDYLLTPSNPQKNSAKPPEPPWLSSNCASMNPIHISFLLIYKQARQVTNCFFKVSHSAVSAKMNLYSCDIR